MWKNTVRPARQATDINTTWRMHIVRWIIKSTNTHSEYLIIIAFPQQQRLRERPSMLRYTYSACLLFTARQQLNFGTIQ